MVGVALLGLVEAAAPIVVIELFAGDIGGAREGVWAAASISLRLTSNLASTLANQNVGWWGCREGG